MNVYAEHHKIQTFLKQSDLDGICIVDDPFDANYIITGEYTSEKFSENLKGIIIPYTGHNRINLADMRRDHIALYVTPTRSRYVAEKAVTLTLALLGRTVEYHNNLKEGNWSSRNSDKRVPWNSIQDAKVGLFGYGRIGTLIDQFLSGFGCQTYTLDRSKQYPDTIKTVKTIENLVDTCDIIIISTPLNITTDNIFDQELLERMKGKFLINVGRGKIVNEDALYTSLTTDGLAGYASDVWYTYPKGKESQYPSTKPLYDLGNVLMSNHSGGFTVHTNDEVNRDIVKQLMKLRDEDYSDQLDIYSLL